MNRTQESVQEKQTPFDSSQSSIFSKLPEEDQQKLATQIVTYLMSPLQTESRYKRIAQKFSHMQTSIIQVVEHRVRLQHQIELNELKEEHFDTMCLVYQKVKQRDVIISQLGKQIKQLDTRYLLKVAQMEQVRVYNEKLKIQVERVKRSQQKQQRVRNISDKAQVEYDDEIGVIQHEIISLKELMKTFISAQSNESPLQQSSQSLAITIHHSTQQPHTNNNLTQNLQQQLRVLKSNLSMRLQMLQQSDDLNQKYQSTQQQLIHGLMDELIRVKRCNMSMNYNNRYNMKTSEQVDNQSQLIQLQYEKSQNSLNDLLQVQLVEMKQRLQRSQDQQNSKTLSLGLLQKRVTQLQEQIEYSNEQLADRDQKLSSITKQNIQLRNQLQCIELSQKQNINVIKLLYQTKMRQVELINLNQTQKYNDQLDVAAKKAEWLQSQLIRVNRQLKQAVNYNTQLVSSTQINNQKTQQHMEEIIETNRSLQNEKVLLKTLNKKINKQLIQAQTKGSKSQDQCLKMKSKIQLLQSQLQDSQQLISSLKLELQIKQGQIDEITENLQQKQLIIKTLTLKLAQNQIQLSQLNNQLQQKINLNQQLSHALQEISKLKSTKELQNLYIQRQQKLKQREQEIANLQQDLRSKQQAVEQKHNELIQKQEQLKKKEKETNEINTCWKNIKLSCERKEIHLNKLQHQLKKKKDRLSLKEKEIHEKESQLEILKAEIQKQILQNQKSPDQQLSPPPSPIQVPMQSPPISPSPFKLESSQPMIPINEDSVKTKLQFIDAKNPSTTIQNPSLIPINLNQHIISQTCHKLTDKWMASEQEKWKSLHSQIDSIYQILLQSQL